MKFTRLLVLLGAVALASWVFREPLLNACFDALVSAGAPVKADMVVVFAGDGHGNRVLKGGELVSDGYVPVALISGPAGYYDQYECDPAIRFSVAHGYPETYFRHFHGTYTNTADEATAIIAQLRKENIKKILVVTSGYHTRRTSRYFKNLDGIEAHMVAAEDRYANHGTWWKEREGRKTVAMEWAKTVATWMGI